LAFRRQTNGVKSSLTRRREIAKWKEASLLRVLAFDSEIPRAARPAGEKQEREEEENSDLTLLCVFAPSREALFLLSLDRISFACMGKEGKPRRYEDTKSAKKNGSSSLFVSFVSFVSSWFLLFPIRPIATRSNAIGLQAGRCLPKTGRLKAELQTKAERVLDSVRRVRQNRHSFLRHVLLHMQSSRGAVFKSISSEDAKVQRR
jgi:hypothetical protein